VSSHAVVLENKFKMSRPIRDQHSHLGFKITEKKSTSTRSLKEQLVLGHAVILKKKLKI
jgi:hypothetical protein